MAAIGREFEETNNVLVSVPVELVGKKRGQKEEERRGVRANED